MAKSTHLSVGPRLTRMNVIASSVTLVLACGAFLVYEYFTFRSGLIRGIETHADIIAANSASALLFDDDAAATETLAALRAEPHIVSIHIFRPDGRPFAAYVRPSVKPAAVPRFSAQHTDGARFEGNSLLLTHRILSEGTLIGLLYIESDLDEMAARSARYAGIVGGVALCSLLTGLLLSARLQRKITRPIFELVEAARTVSMAKNYSVRVAIFENDELGMLGATFNEMLAQIEARDGELRLARSELERRVDERTEALKQEIAERTGLEEQLRYRNEQLVEQNLRVHESNRLKSEFLANMSHELRTPLNAIIGFSELMHEGDAGPVSATQKDFLGDVLVSSRHLLKLINDVLDLSKVEAGKIEFRPEAVDVAAVVKEVRDTLRPLSSQKQLQLVIDVDPQVQSVFVDRSRLKQVLYNYVSNAIKFTPDDGAITIRVALENQDQFRLEVQDSGIGIGAEDIQHLFVEFRQLDSSAAKKYPGTGLGLALSKRLIEAQGGRYGVRSELGHGSTFFAVLPRVAPGAVRGQ